MNKEKILAEFQEKMAESNTSPLVTFRAVNILEQILNAQPESDKVDYHSEHCTCYQCKPIAQPETDKEIAKRVCWEAIEGLYPNETLSEEKFAEVKLIDVMDWLNREED